MTTLSHEQPRSLAGRLRLLGPELWAAVAIVVMWVTVLLATLSGPDIENSTYLGDHTSVPSGVALAPFAFFGTWVVARYGFRRRDDQA